VITVGKRETQIENLFVFFFRLRSVVASVVGFTNPEFI
jgi:hypothetical protein